MLEQHKRRRVSRPYRRVRRWARHTPSGEIALTLVATGVALVFVALVIAFVWL